MCNAFWHGIVNYIAYIWPKIACKIFVYRMFKDMTD